jgi:hypothetical protein
MIAWLPEFAWLLEVARLGQAPADEEAARARFRGRWERPSTKERLGELAGVVVYDPAAGRVEGDRLVAFVQRGLSGSGGTAPASDWVATTATPGRAVGEAVVQITGGRGPVALPIAAVADVTGTAREVRLYYSQWPLKGGHSLRPPLLAGGSDHPQGWPGRYHEALAAGDVQGILETFEPGGYFREPSGERFAYRGAERLRDIFARFFSAGGGIVLEHCAVTDDGRRAVLEYNAVRWGRQRLPPQAGLGVYERGPSGRLQAARVYDDVEPPPEVIGR